MPVTLLEIRRAQRLLEDFCQQRSAAPGSNTRLGCQQKGDSLLIGVLGEPFRPLVKLVYREQRWFLYWQSRSGDWQPWPHLNSAGSFQAVIDELEQAPLHVHWQAD